MGEANRCIKIYPAIIVLKRGLNALFTAEIKTLAFAFSCFAEDLLTLTSNKFRMVCKVDGNPQLDSRDWNMYSDILKYYLKLMLQSEASKNSQFAVTDQKR